MTTDRKLSTADLVDAARDVQDRRGLTDDRPAEPRHASLFDQGDADGYRTRWSAIQTGFVDEPRKAVEEADGLVAEVIKRLTESFAGERTHLEEAWDRNENVNTEDLRQAMQRYRSFFERLLAV
jgi:hypothetical protein